MRGLRFKIQSGNQIVQITQHEYNSDWKKQDNHGLFIYDNNDESEIDNVIEILVDNYFKIYYFLEGYSTGLQDFTIYCIPESELILIGGKNKSCCVNMYDNTIENEFVHCLFWDFVQLDNGYILELGELDCLLRDKNGTILDKVLVDSPYEDFYEADGIRFESDYYGEKFLEYPRGNKNINK